MAANVIPYNTVPIEHALSIGRVSTYRTALVPPDTLDRALELYVWNVELAGALMMPLSVSEVVVRNAASDALALLYGPNWPWIYAFEASLKPQGQAILKEARTKHASVGKVVAELPFGFWQKLFVGTFDGALWKPHLYAVLPLLPRVLTVHQARKAIWQDLELMRVLRNRVAHHEPLMKDAISNVMAAAYRVTRYRCRDTAAWVQAKERVSAVLATRPL